MPIILTIALFVAVLLIGTGFIVFFAIRHAGKENRSYQNFAEKNGYFYDKAMVKVTHYRDYSQDTTALNLNIPNRNPYLDKYADYTSFPFGRGSARQVAYVIDGKYQDVPFTAFTYQFTGNLGDGGGSGGVYGIVMIRSKKAPNDLPEQIFYEKGVLCHYTSGNLQVETIQPVVAALAVLTKNE